ncbi:MAG: ABC transporter ATP-binding protein/permease [Ruminiclostridium sp.]|nr:ABC transporter ATP-binding protein/permease [Ruminiclostridium sp.]
MLQLKNITKDYKLGDTRVQALRGVSMDFRESEFVAVLGQSGCGKTTLLNIIGGLDRYTEGDLAINGKSTKQFKASDWDTYRNHSIGFVFQSYNLIPHQTVLSNVELALTLSGVSKQERRKRAIDALTKVGLADQLYKKPNQMSGGQMQRVAIARALVNNPDILLADEPTGALDSETSVQIMEILKEISKDKLIIMVTHNPELAEKYSNRIIRLLDGKVISDTNPYERNVVEPIKKQKNTKEKKVKKPSMSFFTALSLSLNNLMTKKTRTFMTSFAGSIGIIGIALILAISTGAREYIASVEENTLASYPITIEGESVDMTAIMTAMLKAKEEQLEAEDGTVVSQNIMSNMINAMFTQIQSNDLEAFKKYLEGEGKDIENYVSDIKYSYTTQLNVYRTDDSGEFTKVNPAQLFEKMGMTSALSSSSAMMSTVAGSSTNVWGELIDNEKLLSEQYEVLAGRMPEQYNEVVVMVSKNNVIADYSLYCLGLMDDTELIEAVKKAMKNDVDNIEFESEQVKFTYDELLNLQFRLILNSDYFVKENGIWVDKSEDDIFMKSLVESSEPIKVVGVIRPGENAILSSDASTVIGYTHALTEHLINKVNDSEIVKEQKANPDTDIFTGIDFPDEDESEKKYTMDDITAYIATLPLEQQQEIGGKLQQAMGMGMTEEQIVEAFSKYMPNNKTEATYDGNLLKLGVSDIASPNRINIYPKDFESKGKIEEIIAEYNDTVKAFGNESMEINYTDVVGLMMTSVTTIIDAISYILIAFVAISLVVSSIMIGIITYISVLERTKEIGILRAMGASKRDVSRVFNAETLIVGFAAGVLGIGITLLLHIPANAIIGHFTDIYTICSLPWQGAVILVVISMLLTLIAGLIPARVAANKDPVAALRSE